MKLIRSTLLVVFIFIVVSSAFAQGTHSVTLSWVNPTAPPTITGNNVYYSTTSGGPYSLLFSSGTPITTYTDGNLAGGVTRFYVVTATCSSCNPTESGYSNETKATTPFDKPAAPVQNPPVVK